MIVFAYLNALISAMVVLGVGTLAWGYSTGLQQPKGTPTRLFAISYAVLAVAATGRVVFWDMLYYPRHPELVFAGVVNAAFGVGFLISIYLGHVTLHSLLPEDERARRRWWNAWLYPPGVRWRVR